MLPDFIRETVEAVGEAGGEAIGEGGEAALGIICQNADTACLLREPANCIENPCTDQFTILIFPFLALFIGVVGAPLSRLIRLPYTLFLLIVGIIMGVIGCATNLGLLGVSLQQWVHLSPPTIFFYIFLAPLIFEAAFNTRWHVFKRLLIPILTAAFIIVSLQVGLIAVFQKKVIQTEGWSWWSALMFGAMLSATDPISVTATLKSLGASEFLNTLIEGESLLNDGSAFVLWEEFFENAEDPNAKSVGTIIGAIFELSIGGAVMGVAFGLVSLIILGFVYDEFEVETSLTVIVAFLGFWTAQAPSKLSGVICNVTSGLTLSAFGRHLITPAVREPLHEFWELLSWIANTIVFVHAGVLLTAFIWSCAGQPQTGADYAFIIVWYLFLQVIRIGLLALFKPVMSFQNKWYRWREAFVVGFSGLRGAVSLILALEVAGSEHIPEAVKSRVVLWTTGIVALSLLVNGFLIKPLIHVMKLDKAEKTREDFMHRARSVMAQRTLMVLDTLCVEGGFKSARWSYVANHSLPHEWLEDKDHGQAYHEAVEQIMDNVPSTARRSLEVVRNEKRERMMHRQVTHRLSMEVQSLKTTPHGTPRVSNFDPMQRTPLLEMLDFPEITMQSPPMSPQQQARSLAQDQVQRRASVLGSLSLGPAARADSDFGMEAHRRRSIEADVARYQRSPEATAKTIRAKIPKEVEDLHKKLLSGESYQLTDEDREVRRRLLTAILSHVRAFSNTSLVEYSVLLNLEDDLQKALDANEEGDDYDIFSFLDHKPDHGNFFYRAYLKVIEGKTLRGQTAITTAAVVFGIMTEVLKAEILIDSPIIQLEAERLYEAAAALLNRLEALNQRAFEWVESQLAIYVTAKKQDDILEDLLASGIIDDQEYNVVHEELIEVRRKHIRARHSVLQSSKLPPPPKPRALIRVHPLFAFLRESLMTDIVNRYGELVHLQGGQAVKASKGSLILVLQGAIRPLEDTVLPAPVAAHVRKKNTEVSMAVIDGHSPHMAHPGTPRAGQNTSSSSGDARDGNGDEDLQREGTGFTDLASGATMHWCFPAHNSFAGPVVTLHAHAREDGALCDIAQERTFETQFTCCEIAGSATVFTLPVDQVKYLARESREFRLEITRSLAREIVLESVQDQRPYSLSHFRDSISGVIDVTTVVGRAYRIIERLPYMNVIRLHAGEITPVHLQGPGVLLNGTVRVSIVDSSGLVGAINLLHEELTGPALLPAGGLILQEVHKVDDPTTIQERFMDDETGECLQSPAALNASAAVTELLQDAENYATRMTSRTVDVLAHVLIEEVADDAKTAETRLRRWDLSKDAEGRVDMNGRFGFFRHVELDRLVETRVE